MPRIKRGIKRRWKRKRILAQAKGYYQRKSKLYRYAKEAVDRSQKFAYIGRRLKKRDFRSLWIIRIAAGARARGLPYNQFIHGLKLAEIDLNRKMLAELAVQDPNAFAQLVERAKAAIETGGNLARPPAEERGVAEEQADSAPEPGAEVLVTEAEEAPSTAEVSSARPKKTVKKVAAKRAAPKADREGKDKPLKKGVAKKAVRAKTSKKKATIKKAASSRKTTSKSKKLGE